MAATAPTTQAPAGGTPATGSGPQGKQAPPSAPFRAGTIRTLTSDGYTHSTTPGASATELPNYSPTPNAFLSGLWIYSKATASGNTATVAFNENMPLGCYSSLTFQDANEKPIVGPFDSYTLAQVNKFGGYQNLGDPRASAVYSATTGAGATAGSFSQVLYVPLQVASRDTLGSLQNQSASSEFVLKLTLATSSSIYSTAPTTVPAVVTKILEDGWVKPKATDLSGTPLSPAPPQLGTTQFWTRGTYSALDGSIQQQISQGLGYPIRNFVYMAYDTSDGTRATADGNFPDPFQWIFKGTSLFNVPKTIWQDQMARWYGLNSTTADSANGLENGVYVQPFTIDFSNVPGDELRNGYLPTEQGDINQIVGDFLASTKLYVAANYVAPAAGATALASIRAGG